jgi:hypothetical protein
MASWQFDMHVLPRDGVVNVYHAIPTEISLEDSVLDRCWERVQPPTNLADQFSKILPSTTSWHPQISRWGDEEGNRIDVVRQENSVTDVFVRIDVRDVSIIFVTELLRIARKNSWLIYSADGRLISPSLKKILKAIQDSAAYRFVQDPRRFLDSLRDAESSNPDDLDE